MDYLNIPTLERLNLLKTYIKDGHTYNDAKYLVLQHYSAGGYVAQKDKTRVSQQQAHINISNSNNKHTNNQTIDKSSQHIRDILGINIKAKEEPFVNDWYKKDGPIKDIYPELMFFTPYTKLSSGMKYGTFNKVPSIAKYIRGVIKNNVEDVVLPDSVDPVSYY